MRFRCCPCPLPKQPRCFPCPFYFCLALLSLFAFAGCSYCCRVLRYKELAVCRNWGPGPQSASQERSAPHCIVYIYVCQGYFASEQVGVWGHLASRMTGRGAVGTGHSDQRCFLMRTHLRAWFRQFWGWSVAVVGLPVVGWGGLVG